MNGKKSRCKPEYEKPEKEEEDDEQVKRSCKSDINTHKKPFF